VAITGLPADPRLNRVIDAGGRPVELPPAGLVLSEKLAEVLAVAPGDRLTVEVLEGRRPVREVAVARVVEEYLGTAAYM
jgi:putative ABC transport system permease protein